MSKCKRHHRYKGVHQPRCKCLQCWKLYWSRHDGCFTPKNVRYIPDGIYECFPKVEWSDGYLYIEKDRFAYLHYDKDIQRLINGDKFYPIDSCIPRDIKYLTTVKSFIQEYHLERL